MKTLSLTLLLIFITMVQTSARKSGSIEKAKELQPGKQSPALMAVDAGGVNGYKIAGDITGKIACGKGSEIVIRRQIRIIQ